MLAGVGSNKQIEVWTKPLGDGRTAALIVNTAKVNMATGAPTEPAVSRAQAGSGRGGPIMMSACDPKSDSQVWSLSANPNATWSNGKVTNVKGLASNACWEITGCNEKPGAGIGPPGAASCASMSLASQRTLYALVVAEKFAGHRVSTCETCVSLM